MRRHDLHPREIFQNAAHDQPAQGQAEIEWASDARSETILLHPLLPEAARGRRDHHGDIELLHQLPERARLVVVGIVTLVAGMNEDAPETELARRPLGLLDESRAAARQDCCERIERSLCFSLTSAA